MNKQSGFHHKFVDVLTFGQIYGPKRSYTYELLKQGKIRAIKCGAKTLIDTDSADEYFASLPAYGEAA